jgi:predicted NBD/HSP70 family sugar kinase
MNILVIDVGGTHVKLKVQDRDEVRKIESSPDLTPQVMVPAVLEATRDWKYNRVTIGYPGAVVKGAIALDPVNLGPGWVGFDFEEALGRPVKLINDAAMQALGSYEGGTMLFLGLGTGLGTAMIFEGAVIAPMELGHLPYRKGRTFEDYVGLAGLKRQGRKKWQESVADVVARLQHALLPDYVVLGGGNVKKLAAMPPNCRPGDNNNAFLGGVRLWAAATTAKPRRP